DNRADPRKHKKSRQRHLATAGQDRRKNQKRFAGDRSAHRFDRQNWQYRECTVVSNEALNPGNKLAKFFHRTASSCAQLDVIRTGDQLAVRGRPPAVRPGLCPASSGSEITLRANGRQSSSNWPGFIAGSD